MWWRKKVTNDGDDGDNVGQKEGDRKMTKRAVILVSIMAFLIVFCVVKILFLMPTKKDIMAAQITPAGIIKWLDDDTGGLGAKVKGYDTNTCTWPDVINLAETITGQEVPREKVDGEEKTTTLTDDEQFALARQMIKNWATGREVKATVEVEEEAKPDEQDASNKKEEKANTGGSKVPWGKGK